MSFARCLAREQRHGRRAFRVSLPQCLDLSVRVFPVSDCRAPITEHSGDLDRRSLLARDFEDVANFLWHGVGLRSAVGFRGADAEPAEIVVHMVVAVPATVILVQSNTPVSAIGESRRLFRDEHRLAILVPPAWSY